MKLGLILFLFFILSFTLLYISIEHNAQNIYYEQLKKIELKKLRGICSKKYKRTKNEYTPERSFVSAQREIQKILLKEPIGFKMNNSSLLVNSTLIKVVKVINHIKDNVVLSISTHENTANTAQDNLSLSQKRADSLKAYLDDKTNLPLIVAIGYGEAFSLENRLIEINLKRIKQ